MVVPVLSVLSALRRSTQWLDSCGLALVSHVLEQAAGRFGGPQHAAAAMRFTLWGAAALGRRAASFQALHPLQPLSQPLPASVRHLSHDNRRRAKPGDRPVARPPPRQQQQQQQQQQQGPNRRQPPRPRVNEELRAAEVRAVLPDGTNQVLPLRQAVQLARDVGMDLVEVPGTKDPVVAKVVRLADAMAAQRKAEEEARQRERVRLKLSTAKEMQFTTRIADNDLEMKMRKVDGFLDNGLRVSIVVKHRRNEAAAAPGALEYLLARLRRERPGLEAGATTVGARSVNATVWWPPAVARAKAAREE